MPAMPIKREFLSFFCEAKKCEPSRASESLRPTPIKREFLSFFCEAKKCEPSRAITSLRQFPIFTKKHLTLLKNRIIIRQCSICEMDMERWPVGTLGGVAGGLYFLLRTPIFQGIPSMDFFKQWFQLLVPEIFGNLEFSG